MIIVRPAILIALLISLTHCRKKFGASCADSVETLKLLNEGTFLVDCPAKCTETNAPVSGKNPYTTDSSICRAAIHAGAIESYSGGVVKIVIEPGQNEYPGFTMRTIASTPRGAYPHSFSIK